jgi:hypothetical protein
MGDGDINHYIVHAVMLGESERNSMRHPDSDVPGFRAEVLTSAADYSDDCLKDLFGQAMRDRHNDFDRAVDTMVDVEDFERLPSVSVGSIFPCYLNGSSVVNAEHPFGIKFPFYYVVQAALVSRPNSLTDVVGSVYRAQLLMNDADFDECFLEDVFRLSMRRTGNDFSSAVNLMQKLYSFMAVDARSVGGAFRGDAYAAEYLNVSRLPLENSLSE